MRKILITNSYGAGWSSECSNTKLARYIATYQPIIDKLEEDKNYFRRLGYYIFVPNDIDADEPILKQLEKDLEKEFGLKKEEQPYLGGAMNLCVIEIPDDCYAVITQHDGKENYKIIYDCI